MSTVKEIRFIANENGLLATLAFLTNPDLVIPHENDKEDAEKLKSIASNDLTEEQLTQIYKIANRAAPIQDLDVGKVEAGLAILRDKMAIETAQDEMEFLEKVKQKFKLEEDKIYQEAYRLAKEKLNANLLLPNLHPSLIKESNELLEIFESGTYCMKENKAIDTQTLILQKISKGIEFSRSPSDAHLAIENAEQLKSLAEQLPNRAKTPGTAGKGQVLLIAGMLAVLASVALMIAIPFLALPAAVMIVTALAATGGLTAGTFMGMHGGQLLENGEETPQFNATQQLWKTFTKRAEKSLPPAGENKQGYRSLSLVS